MTSLSLFTTLLLVCILSLFGTVHGQIIFTNNNISRYQSLSPCTKQDLSYSFTPCDSKNSIRYSVSFWTRECAPTPDLPTPGRTAAPCDWDCTSGSFYSPQTLDCEPCPAGTQSTTSDIHTTFDPWPAEFVTYCEPKPCEAWQSSNYGQLLYSGNQSALRPGDDHVTSTLSHAVNVVQSTGGLLHFSYYVESESGFDGLILYLNNTAITGTNTGFLATGMMRTWESYNIPLPFGTTDVRWVYAKDSDTRTDNQEVVGHDGAMIRDIRVDGVSRAPMKCVTCPAGTYSKKGSVQCTQCPMNTYSAAGSSSCTICPPYYTSPPGSAQCVPQQFCNVMTDYTPVYSKCDKSTSTRSKTLLKLNPYCLDQNTTFAPQELYQPCAECPKGMHRVDYKCQPCPAGQYQPVSVTTGWACKKCPPGSAAVPTLIFSDFDTLDGGLTSTGVFSTSCAGMCVGCKTSCKNDIGWEVISLKDPGSAQPVPVLHSGIGRGEHANAVLKTVSNVISPGFIKFQYFFYRRPSQFIHAASTNEDAVDDYSGTFYVNDLEYKLNAANFGIEKQGYFELPLTPDTYTFTWVFNKNIVYDMTSPVSLVLRSLEINGDSRGGATQCVDCQPGYYCPNSTNMMIPCAPGSYQPKGRKSNCENCTTGIASYPGSTSCTACPANMFMSETKDDCISTCSFDDGNWYYDMSYLKDVVFGPIPLLPSTAAYSTEEADLRAVQRFYVKACQPMGKDVSKYCSNAEPSSYVCQRYNSARGSGLGSDMKWVNNGNEGLTITYTHGSICGTTGMRKKTTIQFICDRDRTNIPGEGRFADQGVCSFVIQIRTPFACASCTNRSYGFTLSECLVNGTQIKKYFKLPGYEGCFGGVPLPQPELIPCNDCKPNYYESIWTECSERKQYQDFVLMKNYTNCIAGPNSKPKLGAWRYCATQKIAGSPWGLTIVVAVMLSLLVLGGVYKCMVMRVEERKAVQEKAFEEHMKLQTSPKGESQKDKNEK